ncbi:hypothetical protein TIFTF001_041385 [Ficus carica]|uniref:Uncharacterized protein n=1 Tax=Ficus carica TaxID=3494 RepID=A0AA87ZNL4_FICCA|nr:hypothetical protein TIFTF001_041385 [Ficus carica]
MREKTPGNMPDGIKCLLPLWQGGPFCKELYFEHPRPESFISKPEPQQPVACSPVKARRTLDHLRQIRGS